MHRPDSRRIVGASLLASSVVMLVLAALIWGTLWDLPGTGRQIAAGALLVAALLDVIVGLRFIQRSA